jgi:hypothetical protein
VTASSVATPRFDWYAATVNVGVDDLRNVLERDLGGSATPEEGQRNGYHHREVVRDRAGRLLATILHGGNGDIPHAFASSDGAHGFAGIIRDYWPERHRVSRMDAALDFDGPTAWPTLLTLCQGIADGYVNGDFERKERFAGDTRKRITKIRTNYMGDWHHGKDGRTFGLGSFQSAVYVRLYEKGIQVRQDAIKRGQPVPTDFSEDAVRLEVQVRPDGPSKTTAATATPLEAFGYAEWTRELVRRLDGVDVPRVNIKERRESDHERAMQHMVMQYANHLLIDVAALGSWEALGADLRRRLETGQGSSSQWERGTDEEGKPF